MACFNPATGQATALYYCIQDDCQELPVNPIFKRLRFTGGVPQITRETLPSAELDGTSERTSVRLGSAQVGAEAAIELSKDTYDDLLEAVMQSQWQAGATIAGADATISATQKNIVFAGADYTADISENDLIKLPAMTHPENAGALLVTSISFDGTDTIVDIQAANVQSDLLGIKGIIDETAATDIIVNDILQVGTERVRVALLTEYRDMENGPRYELSIDNECTAASLSFTVNALVTGSLTFIGRYFKSDYILDGTETLEPRSTVEPYSGIDGALIKDGARVLLSTSADITIDRNATPQSELSSQFVSHVSYGIFTADIAISTFFYNFDLDQQFNDEIDGDYTITARMDGSGMAFNAPTAKVTDLSKDVGEGDITQTATLVPYRGSELGSLVIRRVG